MELGGIQKELGQRHLFASPIHGPLTAGKRPFANGILGVNVARSHRGILFLPFNRLLLSLGIEHVQRVYGDLLSLTIIAFKSGDREWIPTLR